MYFFYRFITAVIREIALLLAGALRKKFIGPQMEVPERPLVRARDEAAVGAWIEGFVRSRRFH